MELLDESKKPLFRIRLVAETDQTATYWKISALGESKRTTAMPTMAVSLNGSPLCKYEETSATSTAELFAAVQGYSNETATSVDQLISNAMAALLSRKVLRDDDDDDGALEKFCVMYLILSERVPSPEGVNYTGTIAEWLPAFDSTVNILGHEDGFVRSSGRTDSLRQSI
jgi:hypothetical protein